MPDGVGPVRDDAQTMTAWLAILIPLLVMVFALGMERLETRLRSGTVREDEVEDFLERARPDEVKALFRQGSAGHSRCSGSGTSASGAGPAEPGNGPDAHARQRRRRIRGL